MNQNGNVRLSVEIPEDVHNALNAVFSWGQKAEAVRSLLELLIREHVHNKYIVTELLNGNCRLTVQILNKPKCEGCDE